MANKSYHELTEEEWKIVEKILPPAKSTGRPQTDNRLAFNGILWVLKSGAPWRFLPYLRAHRDMKQNKILNRRVAAKPLRFTY